MQIFVTIPNGRQLDFDVQGVDSLESLRKAIHDKFHPAHPHLCSLAMDGKILAEGTLADNGVMLEATIICAIQAEELLVILNVGGKRHFTILRTLLNRPGSRIHSMFEDMAQGGMPCFPSPATGRGGVSEGVPHAAAGPLPQERDGAFFIDRNGVAFEYVINYLRDGEAFVLPTVATELQQLVLDAQYYGLPDLANACACPLLVLKAACGPTVSVADLVGMSREQREKLCLQSGIAVVPRIETEAQLRGKLQAVLSEAGLRALIAAGQTCASVAKLDAAAAQELGLDDEDARVVGEGEVGLQLRRDLPKIYTGAQELSEAAVRALAGAKLTLAKVRKLDGEAALRILRCVSLSVCVCVCVCVCVWLCGCVCVCVAVAVSKSVSVSTSLCLKIRRVQL